MAALSAANFATFFRAVREREPFPWQQDLAEQLANGEVPAVIDVPTGLGKTSVILCWAFALAVQAQRVERTLPRRLCFVVDRRLVVDDAFADAEQLQGALGDAAAAGSGIVADVAAALQSLHGNEDEPLAAVKMRGGATWDSRWLARPDQAAVIVGTVDQFGSRLLFRGYGVSDGMRPIDAALVGLDTWLIVDEAHIAEPLKQTVLSAQRHQRLTEARDGTGLRPLQATVMSATVEAEEGTLVFKPDPGAQAAASEDAARRLHAAKPVALLDLNTLATARRGQWRAQAEQLGVEIARLAHLAAPEGSVVVGVVVNTIGTARAAFEELRKSGKEALLLIGRVREYERHRLLARWLPAIKVEAERSRPDPLYVVATQTIEVGANLDFDFLVTECAPLPSLIQRFGRVNRLGSREPRRSFIVHAGFAHDDDRTYGTATAETWAYLVDRAPSLPVAKQHPTAAALKEAAAIDFGLLSARSLADDAPPEVRAAPPFVPIALGAHFERWALTSPAPVPDQPVAPFLHGVGRSVPEVSVAWRGVPPDLREDMARWQSWLDLVPPVEWEFVTVPIWEAKALLAGTPSAQGTADIEGAREQDEADPTAAPAARRVWGVVYRGRSELPSLISSPADIRPQDRVVLDATLGGHDEWGWTGRRFEEEGAAVPDVGDLAPSRSRRVLRLARSVLATLVPAEQVELLEDILRRLDPDDLAASGARVVAAVSEVAPEGSPLGPYLQARAWRAVETGFADHGSPVLLLTSATRGQRGGDAYSDQDETSTSQLGMPVTLEQHGAEVGAMAREFAEHVGLPPALAAAVELAGRWHDLGKADPRFQALLHDGDALAAEAAEALLAKSGRDSRHPVARGARRIVGLPAGFRHEGLSARLFDTLQRPPEMPEGIDAELVRHLVSSHHGHSRPLLPPVLDSGAPRISASVDGLVLELEGTEQQIDWSQPARFERLCERYGWWGLAYLETLVRLADMLCSERNAMAAPATPLEVGV